MNAQLSPVDDLIEEALSACRTLPCTTDMRALDERLRAALQERLPLVQRQADGLDRGTVDWWNRQRVIDAADNTLAEQLPADAPLAAAVYVAELGRRLRELDAYAQEVEHD
ncbi:DUF6415 family natural product biosynthesis protein [Streptomyces sp. NPDC059009]|uniref:DUF6415 family natural product biosynthesis protein n=1 Tax=Streptomyces sp. NPDC059009 TaxID=3346694 RepID=UPI00369EF787